MKKKKAVVFLLPHTTWRADQAHIHTKKEEEGRRRMYFNRVMISEIVTIREIKIECQCQVQVVIWTS